MPTKPLGSARFSYYKLLKIDAYLLGEMAGAFFGGCIFIVFILLMFQALRLAEFFIVHGASGVLLTKLAFFMGLSCLPIALPLAFLISILIAFSRLSSDSELVALKACGYHLIRLAVPVTLFAASVAALSIFLNVDWVPWGEGAFKRTQNRLANTKSVALLKEGTFKTGFFDLLIFADKVDARNNRLYRVFIYDEREAKNPLTYIAQEATITHLKTDSELSTAIVLHLQDGSMHHSHIDTQTYEKIDFKSYRLYLKIDAGADTTLLKPHMIPQSELTRLIEANAPNTPAGREFRGEYWRRYAIALSPFIFVLLGIGLGTFRYRTAKTGAILTGILILIIYWTLQTLGTTAVLKGQVPPFMAMQFPNIVMLIFGIFSFKKASW